MTQVFEFLLEQIGRFITFSMSLTFELFGKQVSMLSIEISIIIMTLVIKILTFGFRAYKGDNEHLSFKRRENKQKGGSK